MPDQRPAHYRMGPSLLNTPTPAFEGAGHAMYPNHRYGNRGPERVAGNRAQRREGPPQSIADHVDDALKHVARLTPRQRLAVHNAMVTALRDVSLIKMVAEQAGPWAKAAAQDEGRPL